MEMPPMLNWFVGPDNYGLFMEWVFEQGRNGLVPAGGRRPTASPASPPIGASMADTSCTRSRSSPSPPTASAGTRCSRIPRSSRRSAWRPSSTPRDLSTSGLVLSQVRGMTVQVAAGHGGGSLALRKVSSAYLLTQAGCRRPPYGRGASLPNWTGEGAWSLSASDTTARATARAAYRPGAVTVTTLMIVSARCTLMMLADRRDAARSAATANVTGSGSWPPSRATLMMTS